MKTESLFTQCEHCNKSFHKSKKRCPDCGKRVKKLGAIHWIAIAACAFTALITIAPSEHEAIGPTKRERSSLEANVKLDYSWRRVAFDSAMEADFYITNNNDVDIMDIVIECRHYANSGSEIDSSNRTIYDIVRHGSTERFPSFSMGFMHPQAVDSSCFVKKVTMRQ